VFSFGDTIPFQVTVSDPEDGTVDCARVKMTYVLGHDQHGHPITSLNGCTGTIVVPADGEHDDAANIFGVWDAEYTDNGANGQPALTTHAQNITQPRHRQAEHFSGSSGINTFTKTPAEGGRTVGDIHNGDWISFSPYTLSNLTGFTARASSGGVGGTLQVRAGSPTGTVLGSATVPVTGAWDVFTNVSGTISGAPLGTTTLYLTFAGGAGALYDLDSFTFASATEAESYTSQTGVSRIAKPAAASGGFTVGNVHNGDWTAYSGLNTNGATRFTARVSSGGVGGTIQVRSGSATGTLLGSVAVPVTGGWETFASVTTQLSASASGPLYLVYTGAAGALFDVDSFTLSVTGSGAITGLASKCLDISGGAAADGTKIQLWGCNASGAQKWTRAGQTWTALGKCLDIAGGATADGTNVQLWTCNGSGAQNWVTGPSGSLINPQSGKCLDISGGATADGTQILIWTCSGGTNQTWSLP
jgi:hypothetical protein